MIEGLIHDLRLAWRGLRRARGFTIAAVLTLAVGMTGATSMFALIEGVLLRPLPVRDQDRVLVGWKELPTTAGRRWPFRGLEIPVIRAESRTLEAVAGFGYNGPLRLATVEDGAASYVTGTPVTGDFFEVLGVAPVLGRMLNRSDDVAGAEKVLTITHGLWQRRYGGAAGVLGRRLVINEQPFRIVGVMPPDVEYPRGVEAWMTIASLASTVTNPTFREAVQEEVLLIARLRPDRTIEQAAAELRALGVQLEADAPAGAPPGLTPAVRSYAEVIVGDVRGAMLVLFGAVGLVLLIASANVANLLLVRGEARRPELALRATLGAGRGRLTRQLIAESAVLAVAAGLVGLVVTSWTLQALVALVPEGLPRVEAVRIDTGVVLFAVGLAFVSALLSGLVPALSAVRIDLVAQLRSGGRGVTGRAGRYSRRALVIAQVALAVMIVATAGLLTRSLLQLNAVGAELAADRLVLVPLTLPQAKYQEPGRLLQFHRDAIAQLEASPLVTAATPVNVPPFSGIGWDAPSFTAEGQSAERGEANSSLNLEAIHPNYFKTFSVTLLRGRTFNDSDNGGSPKVAIISEDVAEQTWPGEDPIGKRLKLGSIDSPGPWLTVVGVTTRTRYRELREERATIYVPAEQFLVTAQTLVIRTSAPLSAVTQIVRDRVRAVDPDVRVMRVAPFRELLAAPLARPRFNAFLVGVFGVAALALAAIGLYAVLAASVRQRYAEIGVRVALGATAADVRALILWEGFRLAGAGAAIGLAGAMAGTTFVRGLLFGVHPLDPPAMIGAAILLVGASMLASYLPARRAMRMDPIAALRAD